MKPRFVVWLDRDGTIVDDPGYLADPQKLVLLPHAAEAIRRLREAGGFVALITNQSGIGRGYMTRDTVDRIHARLRALLREDGADLDDIELCPHRPTDQLAAGESPCDCRKPRPGMVQAVLRRHELSGLPAFGIGDKAADLGLARAVGATAILVRTGDGAATEREGADADRICDDVLQAAQWILERP